MVGFVSGTGSGIFVVVKGVVVAVVGCVASGADVRADVSSAGLAAAVFDVAGCRFTGETLPSSFLGRLAGARRFLRSLTTCVVVMEALRASSASFSSHSSRKAVKSSSHRF